ncbi:hypothetical protein D3C86_1132340 [compost metagenome]
MPQIEIDPIDTVTVLSPQFVKRSRIDILSGACPEIKSDTVKLFESTCQIADLVLYRCFAGSEK